MALIAAAVLALANIAAFGPGVVAGRTRAAVALRTE
jgi:hypothetical protein